VPITPVAGRLPSEVLGLHLERSGVDLRLYDPAQGRWLPTPRERAEHERQRAEHERNERIRIEAEAQRLREEIAALRHRLETGE